jgi:hypothetical protein
MSQILHGTVRGRSIVIVEDLGLLEGQAVEVKVTAARPSHGGNGLQRCAGVLAEDWSDEDERILKEIHRERKTIGRRGQRSIS